MSQSHRKIGTKKGLLSKYGIEESTFKKAGITWEELKEIHSIYGKLKPQLEVTANDIVTRLFKADRVHSIRFRLKDEEGLLVKIIRKRSDDPERVIDKTNFQEEITDLIGIRVLHLYKSDWIHIHQFIKDTYEVKKDPEAYIRIGDPSDLYEKEDCKIEVHPKGYRSVHYDIKTNPTKKTHIAEIQVRTIFEEGWSEIDHDIRYPLNTGNEILNKYLDIFNRIAGSADEMGSFIKLLDLDLRTKKAKFQELQDRIDSSSATDEEKKNLNNTIEDIPKLQEALLNESFLRSIPSSSWFTSDLIRGIDEMGKIAQRNKDWIRSVDADYLRLARQAADSSFLSKLTMKRDNEEE